MGMLPIFLAIFGFVLLWCLVNYATLSDLRTKIKQLSQDADRSALPADMLLQTKELQRYKSDYNKLISQKPTFFLAKVFGFGPI